MSDELIISYSDDILVKVRHNQEVYVELSKQGPQGPQGLKGDVGDITPALQAARNDAVNAATEAAASKTAAASSASAAATSASGAASSATAANTSRTQAQTARTGAETARTGAETARTGAEAAQAVADTLATNAAASRDAAAASASGASTSASAAAGSATTANTARSQAQSARDAAIAAESTAVSSAAAAEASKNAAAQSEVVTAANAAAALAAQTGAETALDDAEDVLNSVSDVAAASTAARDAAITARNTANDHATAAAGSASAALTSKNAAAASATAANSSKNAAANSVTTADEHRIAAAASATAAATARDAAQTSAQNAGVSAVAAAASETTTTAAATDATAAQAAAEDAATQANASRVSAAESATNAATSATNALTSETNASASAVASASSAQTVMEAETVASDILEVLKSSFLGMQASDPTTDLNDNLLTGGEIYVNSASGRLRYYNGTVWSGIGITEPEIAATIQAAIDALVGGAAETLDTLEEIAAALGNDPDFAATMTAALGEKLTKAQNLADVPDKTAARSNLGANSASNLTTGTLPAARFNDTAHGNRAGGTLHAVATQSAAGFMSAGDKTKLDTLDLGDHTQIEVANAALKNTPVDGDAVAIVDSADNNALKRTTWARVKATLKSYFDTLYATVGHAHTFAQITSRPTTLAGYGITDAITSSAAQSGLDAKMNIAGGSFTGPVEFAAGLIKSPSTTTVNSTSDFNQFVTPGFWSVSGNWTNGPNGPASIAYTAIMEVYERFWQAGARYKQIVTILAGSSIQIYTRVGTATDVTWTDWVLDYNSGNLSEPTQAEAIAGTSTTPRIFSAQRVRQSVEAYAAPTNHDHAVVTTSVNGFMAAADKVKLNAIAAGATSNATDAALRARSSHTGTQAVSTIDGLQALLDGKAASSHVHAAGDITSGTFADARIPNLAISKITSLQGALDNKVGNSGNESIAGVKTFTGNVVLTPGVAAGASLNMGGVGVAPTSPVDGDVWQTGSTITFRCGTSNRTLGGTGNLSTISRAEAEAGTSTTLRAWTAQRVAQAIAKNPPMAHIHAIDDVTGLQTALNAKLDSTATAAAATKLATARTISLTGGVTGSGSFDGSGNLAIAATVTAHTHTFAQITGTLPNAAFSGSYTGLTNLTGSGNVDFGRFLGNTADTVALPSYSWTADGNTGMYWVAADQIGFTTGGVHRVTINSAGLTAAANISAYSDERFKTDIETISGALALVEQMRGVRFTMNNMRMTGVVAQEIQKLLPEVVIEAEDEQKTLSVAYGNIVGVLIEAIKELKVEVDDLKRAA